MSESVNTLLSSIVTLAISVVTGWASVISTRKSASDKALQAMKDEVALLKDWPEGSSGRLDLQRHLEWLAQRYIADQSIEMQVRIRWIRAVLALVLGFVILSAPPLLRQTMYFLGSPLAITCIYWSIREMAGRNARRRLGREANPGVDAAAVGNTSEG
jgi:hypothetical protein